MTDAPLHERPETQLVLWLSFKHQPKATQDNYYKNVDVAFMHKSNERSDYIADVILVRDCANVELPEWLAPVMTYAFDNDYSLIVFTANGEVVDYLPTYGE